MRKRLFGRLFHRIELAASSKKRRKMRKPQKTERSQGKNRTERSWEAVVVGLKSGKWFFVKERQKARDQKKGKGGNSRHSPARHWTAGYRRILERETRIIPQGPAFAAGGLAGSHRTQAKCRKAILKRNSKSAYMIISSTNRKAFQRGGKEGRLLRIRK